MSSKGLITKPIKRLQKILWTEVALFTKLIRSADGENVPCYTCDSWMKIGTMGCQAGHFLPKGGNRGTYYEPNNLRPQCTGCNLGQQGHQAEFERRLRLEIGDNAVDSLKIQAKRTNKVPRYWYVDQILTVRKANQVLRSGRNGHGANATPWEVANTASTTTG